MTAIGIGGRERGEGYKEFGLLSIYEIL